MKRKVHFEVTSSLGKKIKTTAGYWQKIVRTKHPAMQGKEELVKSTLTTAEQVRRSRKDPSVSLYYKKHESRYCCVVVKHLNGDGFVVTTYMTDRIKVGEVV